MTAHHGKRQAIYRATTQGTAVTCESCARQVVVPGAPSKVVDSLGWWRVDHDMIICDGCYQVATEDLGWIPGATQRFFDQVRGES